MTTYPTLIGFTGRAGSGKTTAADWILRNQHMVKKFSFAGPLRRMIYELLREVLPPGHQYSATDYINDPVLKETPIPFVGGLTARRLMQTLGTEWARNTLHPDFWAAIAAGKIERVLGTSFSKSESVPIKMVCDDVRFANEAALIRAYGGVVVRVLRPDDHKTVGIAGHASEVFDFEADITIVNDGTADDLFGKLAAIWPPTVKPPAPKTPKVPKAAKRA